MIFRKNVLLYLILHFLIIKAIILTPVFAQFAPPAGQPGSTAIHRDSSILVNWAKTCQIVRGLQNIAEPSLGFASVGDSSLATGLSDGTGVVSLGDGGYAVLTFEPPITNSPGWDFAVFENSFSDTFLELAFVEVSSDGLNYFRFPPTSLTQDTIQVSSFGTLDATKINNLAGKYRALYGTPFDLEELGGHIGLDINSIAYVKIIDVVGSIHDSIATFDQYGNKINDPWPTPFPSGGFDLDAVGVIHQQLSAYSEINITQSFLIFPNPAQDYFFINNSNNSNNSEVVRIKLINQIGMTTNENWVNLMAGQIKVDLNNVEEGVYTVLIDGAGSSLVQRLLVVK